MKKYLPIFLFILVVTGFLITQIGIKKTAKMKETSQSLSGVSKKYEEAAKSLIMETLEGQHIEIASIKAPIIIFNFWASWCGSCLEEFPSLVELRKKYSEDQVIIFAISSDNEKADISRVLKDSKLNFQIILDNKGEIFNLFDITSIPSSIIFYKGKVFRNLKGPVDFNSGEFLETLDKLLNKRLALTREK